MMHTPAALIDLHNRTHRSLALLLEHCREFSSEELKRELPGFGYSTMHLQFHHGISAERYWVGVLQGRIDVDEDAPNYPTISALDQLRKQVFEVTEQYLNAVSAEDLNVAHTMMTWGNKEKQLIPAQVILRTQTHLFHHQGQIAVMCRLLGKPSMGSDYPIE